jgi:hypothetical protein
MIDPYNVTSTAAQTSFVAQWSNPSGSTGTTNTLQMEVELPIPSHYPNYTPGVSYVIAWNHGTATLVGTAPSIVGNSSCAVVGWTF